MPEKKINVATYLKRSMANGEGTRFVLWVQGCPFRCPGCFNPQNQDFKINKEIPVSEMANEILMTDGINGVTFSGGEPFAQAAALADLAEILQQHELTVLIFTGYTYAEITGKNDPEWNRLVKASDMLVSGRFEQDKKCTGKPLIGSTNQQVIALTGKIKPPKDCDIPDVEIQITKSGTIYVTGFPDPELIRHLKNREWS
jgi:anaerobic ribonucleoside-triphosphate reductase activating protein